MKKALFFLAVAACLSMGAKNPISGTERGHEWVDMGTSVKWATTNVGATSPLDYGSYFAWGETKPAPNNDYSEENSRLLGIDSIGSIAGDPQYDAAQANWGGNWRMPTKEDWQELIDNCSWTRETDCIKATAKNGNVLYLPYAYSRDEYSSELTGDGGYYWSATPGEGRPYLSWGYFFLFADIYTINDSPHYILMPRCNGLSVRPVLE